MDVARGGITREFDDIREDVRQLTVAPSAEIRKLVRVQGPNLAGVREWRKSL